MPLAAYTASAPSSDSIFFFSLTPLREENPPNVPSARSPRWQGTTSGSGVWAMVDPTARAALGFPGAAAGAW